MSITQWKPAFHLFKFFFHYNIYQVFNIPMLIVMNVFLNKKIKTITFQSPKSNRIKNRLHFDCEWQAKVKSFYLLSIVHRWWTSIFGMKLLIIKNKNHLNVFFFCCFSFRIIKLHTKPQIQTYQINEQTVQTPVEHLS